MKSNQMEFLLIELGKGINKTLVGIFYFPNRSDRDINEASLVLHKYSAIYKNIICMGDFNNNLLKLNVEERNMEFFKQFGLEIIHNSLPTHYTINNDGNSQSVSLIDFFAVSCSSKIRIRDQCWVHGLSHHALIFIAYNIELGKDITEFTYRDYKNLNVEELLIAVSNTNFDLIYCTNSVDTQLSYLNHHICLLLDQFLPLKKFKKHNCKNNVISSPELEFIRSLRDIAFKELSSDRNNPVKRQRYCRLRNKCNSMTRRIKHDIGVSTFNSSLTTKQLWNKLRDIGAATESDSSCSGIDPNLVNKHFVTSLNATPTNNDRSNDGVANDDQFSFRNIEMDELIGAFHSLKSNAVGLDGIPLKFLKIILPNIAPHILHLFNTIITTATFPSGWKSARVVPVPKKGKGKQVSDLRPISIISALSKVWESLLSIQIHETPHVANRIYLKQSGFRKGHSTTTALLDITEDIRTNLDRKLTSILLLLDFTKAFDSVDHQILCAKLKKYFSFSNSAYKLILSYLSNRKQCVIIDDVQSDFLPLFRGVQQGSILGPILFTLFINDLPNELTLPSIHIYADDVQLLYTANGSAIQECVSNINDDLEVVSNWANENGLLLNPTKTQAIAFGPNKDKVALEPIYLNNNLIPYSDKVTNLGIILDNSLSFDKHISSIIAKVTYCLRRLYNINSYLPISNRINLIHALIMPFFSYGAEIYCGTKQENIDRLRVSFNSCIRFIFGLRRTCHNLKPYAKRILGTSFEKYLIIRNITLLHKTIHHSTPYYLFRRMKMVSSNRFPLNIAVPNHTGHQFNKSYISRCLKIWNYIDFKNIRSLSKFRKELYTFININRLDEITGIARLAYR